MGRADLIGKKVRTFYEHCSFPGYEEFQTPHDLVENAKRGLYARALDDQLPLGVNILDAGCGTGQLSIFLSMTSRRVLGIDFSLGSLRKANDFKLRFELKNVDFARMDIFNLALRDESFDYVFCNGVLHHTADAYRGFQCLCRVVKKDGYLIVGLYNKYGRLLLNARKLLFRATRGKFTSLDYYMRQKGVGFEKKRIWYADQYQNPHDVTLTVGDVLGWFADNGVRFVNSVPKINLADRRKPEDGLFDQCSPGNGLDHLLSQLGWIFTQGREGGFFIMIGQKE